MDALDRWDKEQPAGEVMTQLQEVASIVTRLVPQFPLSRAHTVLVCLLTHITEIRDLGEERCKAIKSS